MVRLRAHIRNVQDRVGADLPFEREEILLIVRKGILRIGTGGAIDREECVKILVRSGLLLDVFRDGIANGNGFPPNDPSAAVW